MPELNEEVISGENGVDAIINRLDRIYKKDETLENYMALENFETFKRQENMKISDYLNNFEQLYNKMKSYGIQMSENVLAYQLLKSANSPELHKQMVKGTITNLKFNLMKDQLKKMFRESLPSIEKCPIKAEDTFHTQHASQNHYEELYESDFSDDEECQQQETYLTSYPKRYSNRPSRSRQQEQRNYPTNNPLRRPQQYSYKHSSKQQFTHQGKGKNPRDKDGTITRCSICESINHWAPNCPDNQNQNNTYYNKIVLYQTDYDHPSKLLSFVDKSRNAAILDSRASKTVWGILVQYLPRKSQL